MNSGADPDRVAILLDRAYRKVPWDLDSFLAEGFTLEDLEVVLEIVTADRELSARVERPPFEFDMSLKLAPQVDRWWSAVQDGGWLE